ncbi:hypothetical protein ALP26_03804 [Pseudomonas savastanoi pv. glycinea]|nr:hypothetical protein PsgB076_25893 [Pseudomonas savastanoi pv. glycinea str. B076]EFW87506.1 hypothetical protein PsgRace4_02677 [Pseudomonas savastanoi pv. glycinea str. race 4]KPB34769.1 Uncharacterized protein AC514_2042 [Pseudomonas savastanoi pv. phaseolicola]KPB86330.1 Uncharacterized protein AC504_3875 [Pseudomonas syringae pv. maculicola]KPX45128.1 Uncharacterized protein ALO37_00763 [Pseudomonas savastanoi pv. glycinea]QDV98581.1 hypothetical protein FFH21_000585 [Pseudomonas sp. K
MTDKRPLTRWSLAATLLLCVGTSAFAQDSALHSGKYEQLMLAVTPDHQVEGYYAEERGEDPPFSCAFYLKGNVEAGKDVAVSSWSDGAYPGTLKPSTDGVTLTIEQGQQHSGCLNVLMPDIATGLDLTQTASKQWISLVKVKADKAWLQKTPNAKATRGAYIVKGDVVGVLAFKDGAAQV